MEVEEISYDDDDHHECDRLHEHGNEHVHDRYLMMMRRMRMRMIQSNMILRHHPSSSHHHHLAKTFHAIPHHF